MLKRLLIPLIPFIVISALTANSFYPRLYLPGYVPQVENQMDVYKLNKGLELYKDQPYLIQGFKLDRKEKVDFEAQKVIISTQIGDFKLVPDRTVSFDSYFTNLKKKAFRKSLIENFSSRTQQTEVTTTGLIREFVLEIPSIAMPKAVQKVLGSSPPRLNLDGTQKISLEAGSVKRKNVAIYEADNSSRFEVKMEQETNLRLSGTIGDKISVNLKYNSKMDEQLFDPNNVSLKYTGDEDEIIKSIEAGNITLALAGSRYISYSTASQGLFGVTSKLKYGNLDLTLIASTEEGEKNKQSYIGTSQADSTVFRSRDYAARTMYYLIDPYELYDLYTEADASPNVPAGWINNAIKTNPYGQWMIKPGSESLLPKNGSVRVFIDDANATNNVEAAVGDTIFISPTEYYVPYYDELIEGTDFVTDYSAGTIQINRAIDRRTTIAVTYVDQNNNTVPAVDPDEEADGDLDLKVIRRRNQEYDPTDPNNVWHYQMRNAYNMNKTNIKSDGFTLNIYTINVDLTRNYLIPDSLSASGILTYNDYLRMDSSGDGLINGDDNTVNLATGIILIPFIEPFKPLGDGIIYTDENESISYLDISLYLSVKGKIGREAVDLSQGGILKGSVIVKVNGVEQKENVDYLVDYDFGRITFLTSAGKDPDAKIEIDYEFRSTFSVASKSLAGARADWNFTDYAKLGGTFIYRTENVADRRPRIGNENIQMMMADVDGSFTVKPRFVTKWLDALPFLKTSAESRFTLSGELAFTIPNIYGDPKKKTKAAYIDDMESIEDSYPMGVTIGSWSQASKPYNTSLAKGRTIWYNPKNIYREQLEDPATLTDNEKKETVTVLALKVFPSKLGVEGGNVESWGGVMKYLGNQLDFSQKKYLQVLVKVLPHPGSPAPNPTMRIDIGDINEDFYTEFGGLGVLNSEDKNSDGVLSLEEDVGLDGIPNGQPGDDPNDDASNVIDQYGDYPKINGTEGNRVLDTEDLDNNGVLNTLDRYFSYAFSLTDSLYLESVNHDGWRLYRIPLTDPNSYVIVNNSSTSTPPTLKKISYGRIILETDETAKVLISEVSAVGNKWQDFYVRYPNDQIVPDALINSYNTSYLSGIVNNQKNSSHYTSPEGTYYIEDERETSESALSLQIQNLQPGHQVLLRQRLFDPYSLLSYSNIKYYFYPEASDNNPFHPDSVEVIFRVGADSLNYYQASQRVAVIPYQQKMQRDDWTALSINLQDLTSMKEAFYGETSGSITLDNTRYSFKGNPTLTNVRDIYFGIYNPTDIPSPTPMNGTIYFNDLTVTDPYEDVGVARRVSLNSVFADFSTLDVDYEEKSENFNTTIQRGRSNTFTSLRSLNISNKYFLNKFFPASWGLDMPLSLMRTYSLGIPRFRANSDLLRDNIADPDEKHRERNENLVYSADFGISQRTAPKNKILAYTIYRSSFSGRIEKAFRHAPTAADTTFTWRGTYNYNLSFPSNSVSIPLFKNYSLGFFPTTWNNSFTLSATEPQSWNWERRDNVYNWHPRSQTVDTKLFTSDTNINWGLTSDIALTLRFNSKRDLIQKQYLKKINVGKLTEYVQDLGVNYNPNYFRKYFNLTLSGSSRFSENQRKYYQNVSGVQTEFYQSDGNSNRTVRANLALTNSTLLSGWADALKARHGNKQTQTKPDESDSGDKPEDLKQEELKQEEENKLKEEMLRKLEKQKWDEEAKKLEEERQRLIDEGASEEELRKWEELNQPPKDYDPSNLDINWGDPKYKYEEGYDPNKDKPGEETTGSGKKPDGKSSGFYLPGALLSYLSKIKNITLSYQNAYKMGYSRKDDRPPFIFQLGLPHTVPESFLDSTDDENTFTLASGIIFHRRLDSTINYSYSLNKRYSTASNQSKAVTFPDVTLSLMELEKIVGLGKFVTSSRLNSGFQYTIRSSGDIDWEKPKQESKTIALNPLLGITGTLFKNLSANISYTINSSDNVTDMDTYDIIKKANSNSLNGNLSYSFRSGRGFTIPFTKKKIHIKNELTSSLAIVYERNFEETFGRESSQVDRDGTRISITPGATYQFNADIRGGLTGTWEKTSDKKRDTGMRTFRLGIWAEVNL
jgi:hypothetical protein